MHEPHCLLHERNAQRHLRTNVHLVLHERRDEAGGEADDLGLVVRDVELEVLDELDEDRLHLNNATERREQAVGQQSHWRPDDYEEDSREPPAKARLQARAERHQIRRHPDVRRAHLLLLYKPVRVELVRVGTPDRRQPVVRPDGDDALRALGDRDLAHCLSVRSRDWGR